MKKNSSEKREQGQLWKISTGERFQIWPEESVQRYLTKPTKYMPTRFVNSGNIEAPRAMPFDVADSSGIESAAFSLHKKGFYISRHEPDTFGLIYVIKGRYNIRTDSEKFEIGAGMLFVLPAGYTCEDSARGGDVNVLWFRIKNSPFWRKVFGNSPQCRSAKFFGETLELAKMYSDEAYSEHPSVLHLQNILKVLTETLRREFSSSESARERLVLERLIAEVSDSFRKKWTAAKGAEFCGITTKALNALCEEFFGATFPKLVLKMRMEKILELVLGGATLRETAKRAGFADGYSLSNAFKAYYGSSPKAFIARLGLKKRIAAAHRR